MYMAQGLGLRYIGVYRYVMWAYMVIGGGILSLEL